VPHARTDTVTLYADGVRIEEIGQSARRYFLVDDPELACAILLQAARRRRAEIRPARRTERHDASQRACPLTQSRAIP
jgi:hypothetical protein